MLDKVKGEVTTLLARVQLRSESEIAQMETAERAGRAAARRMQFQHAPVGGYGADGETAQVASEAAALPKVGRNEPCPCGSGKKYKHCRWAACVAVVPELPR